MTEWLCISPGHRPFPGYQGSVLRIWLIYLCGITELSCFFEGTVEGQSIALVERSTSGIFSPTLALYVIALFQIIQRRDGC